MKGVTFKFDDLIYHESFFLYTKLVAFRYDVCSLIYGIPLIFHLEIIQKDY